MSSSESPSSGEDDPTVVVPAAGLTPVGEKGCEEPLIHSRWAGGGFNWVPPLPEEMASLLPGFEFLRILGRGGMGAVYLGRDRKLERLVAIKLLPPELSSEASYVERFMREAKALAKLDHHNIVHIYSFDQTNAGHLYFVMEYVDGMDLQRLMHRMPAEGLPSVRAPAFPPATTLDIVSHICDALQFAHDKGVIHRDIKPANVLIAADGRVKVVDFGLARPAEPRSENAPMTQTGTVMGTPDYMAPEQREGQPSDHRADIYALGVMFYEMLTGSIPRGAFPPPSRRAKLDVRLDDVVLKALQSEPTLRYQRASEIKTDVQHIQATAPASKRKSDASSLAMARRRWLIAAAAIPVLAGIRWAFFRAAKPEVLPQEEEWTFVEGRDAEFEIKFRNADFLVLKDYTRPNELYLDTVRDYADGLHVQIINCKTRASGAHTFSVAAKAAGGGEESPPVKFTFTITAEDVRDTTGRVLRELTVNVPLVAGLHELARGCVYAAPEGLDYSGLRVEVDPDKRVAWLAGIPAKSGRIEFTVRAAAADGRLRMFSYIVNVKP